MLAAIAFGFLYGRALVALHSDGPESNGRLARSVASVMVGSLVGGAGVAILVAAFAPMLSGLVVGRFGPAEYAALIVFALGAAATFMPGSLLRALLIIVTGLLLGHVGSDIETGQGRLTFDVAELAHGIGFVNIAFGFYVIADMIRAFHPAETHRGPALADSGDASREIVRGTVRGLVAGLLAAGSRDLTGATREKSRDEPDVLDPPRQPSVAAIAGAAAASNAHLSASFLLFLALGIPTNSMMALLVGAMTKHGIVSGPQVKELHWALLATITAVHFPLLVLTLTIGRRLLWLSRVNYGYVAPVILAFGCFGIYSTNNAAFDVWMMILFGLFGYVVLRSNLECSLLFTAFVLGPLLEENIRRA
jgi:putative tricarboxylic transport membrane protein